jgi:hypothetical protein
VTGASKKANPEEIETGIFATTRAEYEGQKSALIPVSATAEEPAMESSQKRPTMFTEDDKLSVREAARATAWMPQRSRTR